MKNQYTILFGVIGFIVMGALVVTVCCAHSVNPVFVAWSGVVGALMAGEIILFGLRK